MLVKWHFWKALWLFVHLGAALNADLSLEPKDAGFFLRPLFGPQASSSQADSDDLDALEPDLGTAEQQPVWVDNTPFVINNAHRHVLAKVVYGPYSAEEYISAHLLDAAYANQTGQPKNIVVGHLDISAHIVSRSITQDRPILQVLFHASSILSTTGVNVGPRSESKWCLQMHAQPQRDVENELRSVCVLSDIHNVCLTDIVVPVEWWLHEHLTSADVYFSAYPIDDNLQCSSAHTVSTATQGDRKHALPNKRYIGSVTLSHGQLTYQEVREDQHVLIYIPQKNFYPGFKFRVPVKLQAESDLEVFVVRVKARHGVTVIGAEATNPEKWHISLDLNNKRHGAMVTAFIKDKDKYVKTDRIQEVFDWIFEVDEDAGDDDAGRIILNLEYEMNNLKQERYGSVQNRVVVRVHIQDDNVNTIIPIIKQTELVNTAMLTGRLEAFPMAIYSMNQVGKVTDITSQTTCHSGDEEVLKVAESCNMVYLDGTESKGSPSVNVIAKYGRHTKFLFFKVWVPELPLDVEISDNKLSQIKAWKAPVHQASVPIQLQRHPRGVQSDSPGMITHPDLVKKDNNWQQKGSQKKTDPVEDYEGGDYSTSCHLKFQQAEIQVYAHFYNQDSNRNQYLTHRKAKFRITDLIEDRLRIADSSIASLSGNIVQGLQPGRTEVQVLSQMGRVVGAKEIRVGNNKVSIQRLEVDVVTGVSLTVEPQPELPGTLMAKVTRRETLHKKYQEAILDVNVLFSDGTRTPIRHIPPSDYFLDMDTLNNHVVAFGPMFSADQPRIIALGEGSGELLKLALELGDACQRKKSRPLAVSYVYVNVDLSKDGTESKDLQNDGGMRFDKNRNSDADVKAKDVKQKPKEASDTGLDKEVAEGDIVVEGLGDNAQLPSHEAQQQQVSTTRGMTALEIGMYVLLGIFCVAIVVFMVNCMVFVWRYRHKRMPYEMTDSIQNANEWVWIGKATLERNSINTACSQTLVPDSDFNGNQSPGSNLLAAPTGPSAPGNNNPAASARNSTGTAAANVSNNSNRNSVVSTYKGSECSIRITSNPHPDVNSAEAGSSPPDASQPAAGAATGTAPCPSTSNASPVPCTPQGAPIPPPRTTSAGARPPSTGTPLGPLPSSPKSPQPMGISSSDTGSMDESSEEEAPPLPPKSAQLLGASPVAGGNLNLNQLALQQLVGAEGGMANLNIVNNNSMQEELWDYEAMGLTYEQLMEYFDNLKESTA